MFVMLYFMWACKHVFISYKFIKILARGSGNSTALSATVKLFNFTAIKFRVL